MTRVPHCIRASAITFLVVLWMIAPVAAQNVNLGGADGSAIEIFADDGIEWQQDNLIFLARGNARAVRGNVTVLADQLTAFYAEKEGGTTEIYRLDADGKVQIKTAGRTVFGDKAVYDVNNEILTVNGENPRMESAQSLITARNQLEYWEKRQMAVARGKAVAIRDGREVRGDVLAAFFRKTSAGENKVYRVDAYDNVSVITKRDQAFGDRGVYEVETGIATLTGSVKIQRGANVLNGCKAQVNLNTGISNLFSCPGGRKSGRVSGTLVPKRTN